MQYSTLSNQCIHLCDTVSLYCKKYEMWAELLTCYLHLNIRQENVNRWISCISSTYLSHFVKKWPINVVTNLSINFTAQFCHSCSIMLLESIVKISPNMLYCNMYCCTIVKVADSIQISPFLSVCWGTTTWILIENISNLELVPWCLP